MNKILIAAGGTGGHIIPALSIARELSRSGNQLLFIGNRNSIEEKLITGSGYDFHGINIQKLYRKLTFLHLKFPFKLIKSILDSSAVIRSYQPDMFLGTGGFVSGPVGYAAKLMKIPIFLQEQNSFPGKTTRLLAASARKIFLGTAAAQNYFSPEKVLLTGNPINPSLYESSSEIDPASLGLKKDSFKLFVIGGSQGSYFLNKSLMKIIDELLDSGIEIIWQTGSYSFDEIKQAVGSRKGIYCFDFDPDPGKYYRSADIALARCGALTLAELETCKLPALLVPLPSAAGNHQYYNGMEQVEKGIAVMLEQKDISPDRLRSDIIKLRSEAKNMVEKFGESIHTNAASTIAAYLEQLKG